MNKDITLEDLDFELKEIKKINDNAIYNGSIIEHRFIYKCKPNINNKYSWLDIEFNLLTKEISFFQNSMNAGHRPIIIGKDLQEAIYNKRKELGWLDE